MFRKLLSIIVLFLSATAAHAYPHATIMAFNANNVNGFQLNFAPKHGFDVGVLNFNYAVGLLITESKKSNNRYQMDEFSNGQSRCRDMASGQFADTENCSGTNPVRVVANLIASVPVTEHLYVGATHRIVVGDKVIKDVTTVDIEFKRVAVNIGKNFIGLSFNIGHR